MQISKIFVLLSLTLSGSALAAHPVIDTLSVDVIKQQLSAAEIQSQIQQWHQSQLSQIDVLARQMYSKVSLDTRRAMVRQNIEHQYQELKQQFDLK